MAFRIGVVLIMGSILPWLLLPVVPFLPLSGVRQGATAGGLVVAAELIFWPGLALAGKGAWQAAKARGWRRLPAAMWEMLRTGRPLASD